MPHTIKNANGKADGSVTINGTETIWATGPPQSGAAFTRGLYIRQVAGASGTWRWVEDQSTPGVASPSTFNFMPGN